MTVLLESIFIRKCYDSENSHLYIKKRKQMSLTYQPADSAPTALMLIIAIQDLVQSSLSVADAVSEHMHACIT